MAKLYSKKKLASTKMLPKKETIQFILNYSKALFMTPALIPPCILLTMSETL